MATLEAPLLSLKASGRIGNGPVYSSRNGQAYVKEYAIPSDPKTPAQVSRRVMFGFLAEAWPYLLSAAKATWDEPADRLRITPANAFMASNLARWKKFKAPQQQYRMSESLGTSTNPAVITAPGKGFFVTGHQAATNRTVQWGSMLFVYTVSLLTPTINRLTQIHRMTPLGVSLFTVGPLPADNYYYSTISFTLDGRFGTTYNSSLIVVT